MRLISSQRSSQLLTTSRRNSSIQQSCTFRTRIIAAGKQNDNQLGDDLLDFIQAGRKLRRWYGEGEKPVKGVDTPEEAATQQDEDEEPETGNSVLVTDAEGSVGEQVVLQLILSRANVKVAVKDVVKARSAYGPYVTPISLDISNPAELKKALKGVNAIVVVGKLGAIPKVAPSSNVNHVCLLSMAGISSSGGLFSMFRSTEEGLLSDPSREAALKSSGVPFSVIRSGQIRQIPGGLSEISLSQGDPSPASAPALKPVSCEDLASVIVTALQCPPVVGRYLSVFNSGSSPSSGWQDSLQQIQETAPVA